VIRDCRVRVGPDAFDRALLAGHPASPAPGEALALDGKTMKGAIEGDGAPTHVVSLIGHDARQCLAQKKSQR